MHCQWHYNHWKVSEVNQKRQIAAFISRKEKEEGKEKNL